MGFLRVGRGEGKGAALQQSRPTDSREPCCAASKGRERGTQSGCVGSPAGVCVQRGGREPSVGVGTVVLGAASGGVCVRGGEPGSKLFLAHPGVCMGYAHVCVCACACVSSPWSSLGRAARCACTAPVTSAVLLLGPCSLSVARSPRRLRLLFGASCAMPTVPCQTRHVAPAPARSSTQTPHLRDLSSAAGPAVGPERRGALGSRQSRGPQVVQGTSQLFSVRAGLQPASRHALAPCTQPSTQCAHSPAHTPALDGGAARQCPLAVSAHTPSPHV